MKTCATILVALAVVATSSVAVAQRGAASKITGSAYEYPYFYGSAGMYQHNAYQHADVLREATSYGEPVPAEIAKEHTAAIRSSVNSANKKYANLRKMAGDNKQVHKHLDTIDQHHKKVLDLADKIDASVASGTGDADTVNAHAHDAAESLKAAQAEHEKLMKYFGQPQTKSAN
ncbi:MAG: hypothetical protein DWQ37_08175 [Planctomycetota bacterium]|nr:MAG: hypothetical protein DWQ37_08175 [Planctomycetota bacterium]